MPMGQVPLFVRARSIHQQKRVKLAVPNITLRRKSRRTTSPSDHLAVRWSVCRPTRRRGPSLWLLIALRRRCLMWPS